MPDVVLHHVRKNWLLLVESVTSHGPMDGKRHSELTRLFAGAKGWPCLCDGFSKPNHHGPIP
jgi:hypothetical protein